MKLRKCFIAVLTIICTLLAMNFSTPVFAADERNVVDEFSDNARSISGYGYVWHNTGEGAKRGAVQVTGSAGIQGHLTVGLDNFNSNTRLKIWVYSPVTDNTGTTNQIIFYRENVTINDGPWENISFYPAPTGTYWVQCEVMSNDSAGRVNCWIY